MRIENWENRLIAVLEKHRNQEGRYGKSDCWCLMADAYKACTGKALLPHLRKYSSEKSGYRLFRKHGFETVSEALSSVLDPVSKFRAKRGDLAVVMRFGIMTGGVITDYGFTTKTKDAGLVHLNLTEIITAYEVR